MNSSNFPSPVSLFHHARAWWTTVLVSALVVLTSCATGEVAGPGKRVLFLGNSVVYTNNLPAVFAQLAAQQPSAPRFQVDMFARGGASLTETALAPEVTELLATGRYDVVVLQERGGDDLCVITDGENSSACRALIEGHVRLARLAREGGANVLYLGTYQTAPTVSKALERAERIISGKMEAHYLDISERLRQARASHPDLQWLHADKGHPGIATTALMAEQLYQAITGHELMPKALCTDIALYQPNWKYEGLATHEKLMARTGIERCLLTQEEMETILALDDPVPQARFP